MKQMTTDTGNNKVVRLKRHKRLATGLFLLMLAIYACSVWLYQHQPAAWISYIEAFSEAAMVGALADWFAVTALFHHPLGIPIPHTNLIEKSKQSIADNLGNFVVSNFLTARNLRPYIQKLSLSTTIAQWLQRPKNKDLLLSTLMQLLQDILNKLDDKAAVDFISAKAADLIERIELHQLAGKAVSYFSDRPEQEVLVGKLALAIKTYIEANSSVVQERVKSESYFFVPGFIDKKLAGKITVGLAKYFEEIASDKAHPVRAEIKLQLNKLGAEIQKDEQWKLRLDSLKHSWLSQQKLPEQIGKIWLETRKMIGKELQDTSSVTFRYISGLIDEFAANLGQDPRLRDKIDRWVKLTVFKLVLRNTGYARTLIATTIGNWQGRELSEKLELEVGKDLQFIRINGTLVGGLVGLLLHALTQLFT
jgi:uncharacterized membrane-anchored protein YjiN (DUF445 family)